MVEMLGHSEISPEGSFDLDAFNREHGVDFSNKEGDALDLVNSDESLRVSPSTLRGVPADDLELLSISGETSSIDIDDVLAELRGFFRNLEIDPSVLREYEFDGVDGPSPREQRLQRLEGARGKRINQEGEGPLPRAANPFREQRLAKRQNIWQLLRPEKLGEDENEDEGMVH